MQNKILYGADYNPEQWIDTPEIWDEDLRLMNLAHANCATIGIFSWAMLEPKEGVFDFEWLDTIIEKLSSQGKNFILATPSGAKPAWLALKYPETRRCDQKGHRLSPGGRHNHCQTSPVYREKAANINRLLAKRYGHLPQLAMWHLSNEYGGYCYCDLCFAAFRDWLKERYQTIEALNHAWWARFWSHAFTDWEQIVALDAGVHGMMLDWRRFMTDQTIDFMRHEIEAVKSEAANAKFTTNFMGTYEELNYWKFMPYLDIVSWDSYPDWHGDRPDWRVAASTAFLHDLNRALGQGTPWVLMEKTPSAVNWKPISRPMRPGLNRLSGLQAVAHGADGVCYFQWRKSRGSMEKFHGAVVDHVGHEHNRVFREAAALGADLERLSVVADGRTQAEVGLVFDWENNWAINYSQGQLNVGKNYQGAVESHYLPFWERGIAVDVIESVSDFSPYKLLIAPMLYMLRPGVAEAITEFVRNGGTFVATYLTGQVDESDLCFLGGFPGPLRELLGIWIEEGDVLKDGETQTIRFEGNNDLGLQGEYLAHQFCDVIHAESAQTLAVYGQEYYADQPAVTVNSFGQGRAYFVASRNEARFNDDLLGALTTALNIKPVVDTVLPQGVSAQMRSKDGQDFLFLLNFTPERVNLELSESWESVLPGGSQSDGGTHLSLEPFGGDVFRRIG